MVHFIYRHMEGGGSVSTVEWKMACLAFLFKLQGLPDFTKLFWVKQAVKGYRKCRKHADAGTFSILQAICENLGVVC